MHKVPLHRWFVETCIYDIGADHFHQGRDAFVPLAGLFGNQPEVLAAAATVLLSLGQVVNDSLSL